MNDATLRVGSKKSGDKFAVTLDYQEPTTEAEVIAICKSEAIRVACFNRGWRIRLQENSGAREYISALSAKQRDAIVAAKKDETLDSNEDFKAIVKLVNDYIADPTTTRKSGRPATPQEVVMPSTLSKKDAEKFAEILKSQGIKVTIAQ
jgi:hypothetical protein